MSGGTNGKGRHVRREREEPNMKLSKIVIRNLRGISELSLNTFDYTTLIGPNNSGKSTIIRAIEILLNQEKPEISEWKQNAGNTPIEIEGIFDHIEQWERDVSGVSGLICDSKIQLKAIATQEEGKVSLAYQAFIRPVNITGFADQWPQVSDEVKQIAAQISIDTGTKWKTAANKERVRERIITTRPDLVTHGQAAWTDENISIAPALKQAIPQAIIVHAVKDATEDSKPGSKTPFGILLSKKILPAIQATAEYQGFQNAITALSNKIRATGDQQIPEINRIAEEISSAIAKVFNARVVIKMDPPEVEKFLGSNTGINLHDGIETPIHLQGHGVQRALIFALIEVLAKQDLNNTGRQRSTIILFEEPELYLHPHLMRKLKAALKSISTRDYWQVCVSTHSPFFVEIAETPKSLVIMQKTANQITKKQLDIDPFEIDANTRNEREVLRATLDFHPTVAEVFFASNVVLVEGDTEVAVFRHSDGIHNFFNIPPQNVNDTSVVSCGGKWTIPALANVLSHFGIQFRIIHDCDKKGRTDEEIARAPGFDPFKANIRIATLAGPQRVKVVQDTFEDLLWATPQDYDKKDKPFQAWQRIREIVRDNNPAGHQALKDVFQFAFGVHPQ